MAKDAEEGKQVESVGRQVHRAKFARARGPAVGVREPDSRDRGDSWSNRDRSPQDERPGDVPGGEAGATAARRRPAPLPAGPLLRSEERRVGKECRSRW